YNFRGFAGYIDKFELRDNATEILIKHLGTSEGYQQTADTRSALLTHLRDARPSALPYFVSFCSGDTFDLVSALHGALGEQGFLSSDNIETGSEWRRSIETALRKAKTLFMIESRNFHTR